MQHRITIKTLASPQSTHLVRFCIFQCMLVILLDLWNLFNIFNFLCINYFLNCMCVPWCICYPQKVRRGHETPRPGAIDGCEWNPGHLQKQQLPLTGHFSSPSVFLKYSFTIYSWTPRVKSYRSSTAKPLGHPSVTAHTFLLPLW